MKKPNVWFSTVGRNLCFSGCMTAILLTTSISYGIEFSSPTYGGSGGTSNYNLDCGRGSVLVGVQGKAGQWLDNLMAVCQQIRTDGRLGTRFTRGPAGGSGGSVVSDPCPNGQVVGEVFAETKFGFVSGIILGCDTWNSDLRQRRGRRSSDATSILTPSGLSATALLADLSNNGTSCPSGVPGKALRGRNGIYVDSVRLVCDRWDQ